MLGNGNALVIVALEFTVLLTLTTNAIHLVTSVTTIVDKVAVLSNGNAVPIGAHKLRVKAPLIQGTTFCFIAGVSVLSGDKSVN